MFSSLMNYCLGYKNKKIISPTPPRTLYPPCTPYPYYNTKCKNHINKKCTTIYTFDRSNLYNDYGITFIDDGIETCEVTEENPGENEQKKEKIIERT